jgi:hypothetical protein
MPKQNRRPAAGQYNDNSIFCYALRVEKPSQMKNRAWLRAVMAALARKDPGDFPRQQRILFQRRSLPS